MPLTKEKKEQVLSELKEQTKNSSVVVFVNFHGLGTSLSSEVRNIMRGVEAKYFVAKKTLIKKALKEFGFSGDLPELKGEVALVFGRGDVTLSIKPLADFSKKHEEISLLGGIVDESFVGEDVIKVLASLPTREVLLSQFVNVINAPRQGLVGVLSGVQRNFINVLSQIKN